MEKHRIQPVDTLDYSDIKRFFLFIISGIGDGYSQEIQVNCEQVFMEVITQLMDASEIKRTEKRFLVTAPLQNIPNITSELAKCNIGVYGAIPVEEVNLD